MIIKVEITEDILKLIPLLYIQEEGDDKIVVDRTWMYGGSQLLDDIAMALGIEHIKGTEDDAEGKAYSEEDTKKMLQIHEYIKDNLFYIESIIHQYVVKGGINVGTYKCKANELIWTYNE